MANILILGGGFGGLIVAERLAASIGESNQITLVAPARKFTFYPALVHLAFSECEPDDITFDLAIKLQKIGVRYVQGEVVDLDTSARTVKVTGDDISGNLVYDYLVIAVGRRLATEQVPGFFEYSNHLLGTNAALRFGGAIKRFKTGRIIVGLCPDSRLPVPACETAFALAKRFRSELTEGSVHISLIFPESLEAAFGGASLHNELENALRRNKIQVHYNIPIREITDRSILSSEKHQIDYDLLMMIPPFRGNSALSKSGITDTSDFVKVNDLMKVSGLDGAYAVGDIVAFSGPKFAHMAVRQAEVAAANIISEINGIEPTTAYYHEIATIIDAGGSDSIYLHYGIWDDSTYRLKKGRLWGWAKEAHDAWWQARNRK
ncbi:MAG: FAD-dependent oxidoreductase [Pyrinomonadaceae bacterium]